MTLRDDGADTALRCTISGSSTTCSSGDASATVAGASAISLEVSVQRERRDDVALVGFEAS